MITIETSNVLEHVIEVKINRNEKFVVSYLGSRTLHGHQTYLKESVKKKYGLHPWDNRQPIDASQNPFLFPGPIQPNVENYIDPVQERQVVAFVHSFSPYFREIERTRKVNRVYVAHNFIHKRVGHGFIFELSDGSLFHGCVGCQNVNHESYCP